MEAGGRQAPGWVWVCSRKVELPYGITRPGAVGLRAEYTLPPFLPASFQRGARFCFARGVRQGKGGMRSSGER